MLPVHCVFNLLLTLAVVVWKQDFTEHYLLVNIGNEIDEPGAEALLCAVRDQTTLSQSITLTKVPSVGLLRFCIQVFRPVRCLFLNTDCFFICFTLLLLPPLGHIWDVMLVWRKGNIKKNCLCVRVLCTVIMVHEGVSSSYRLVDCIGIWSCLV